VKSKPKTMTPIQFHNSPAGQHSVDAGILARAYGKPPAAVKTFNSGPGRTSSIGDRRRARTQFANEVAEEMKKTGCCWDAANVRVSKRRAAAAPRFANSEQPVFGPQMKAAFHLPQDATESMCSAAWKANGETTTPINPGKVFAALVELAQKEKSLDYDAALRAMKSQCPILWQEVEAISKSKV
jgi:hypothetical protein